MVISVHSDGGAGKTCLLNALRGQPFGSALATLPAPTDGVNVVEWDCVSADHNVRFNCYDFAGQEVYYTTHQLFLSAGAVYLLVWHPRTNVSDARLQFWLQSIVVRDRSARVIVVSSHSDENVSTKVPLTELQMHFPTLRLQQLAVSSLTGDGISDLRSALAASAVQAAVVMLIQLKAL